MIYVITGPPCVGKSTWVDERARGADMVVDLDRIAAAISPADIPSHYYAPHIRNVARAMRRIARGAAIRYGQTTGTAYIIDAKPGPRDRGEYRRAGAQFVDLDAPLEILVERCKDQRPAWVLQTLYRWHDTHEPQ